MTTVFRCTLPLPPSVNASLTPVRTKRGATRFAHTDEAKAWTRTAHLKLLTYQRPPELRRGPVAMVLRVYVPTIASDGGNRLKLLEDALVKARVIDDDRQLATWTIVKVLGEGEPRVEVELKPADPAEHPELAKRLGVAEAKRSTRSGSQS